MPYITHKQLHLAKNATAGCQNAVQASNLNTAVQIYPIGSVGK
jgi:hypothetical protein